MAKTTTTKKKPMTLEDFAAAVHKDYVSISKGMATKDDIREIRKDMATKKDLERFATKEDIDGVRDRISNAKEELQEQIAGLRYAKEIDDLRDRVKRVEKQLGIPHTSSAA